MNFERSWRRWLLEWLVLLVVTYALTWVTMAVINTLARAEFDKHTLPKLRWAKPKDGHQIPATTDLLTGEGAEARIKHFDVGAKKWDDLPAALKEADPKVVYWQVDPELDEAFVKSLFINEAEDYFDQFYMKVLRIPLQPINREKHVREYLGYTAVLETAADEEREPLLRHFGNVYGEFMKAMPCRVIRWMNGWVQVTAVAAFWLALLIVGKQYWVLVLRERRRARPYFPFASTLVGGKEITWSDSPEKDDTWLTETQVADELQRLNAPELGQYPGVAVLMLREAYDAYNRSERDARDGQGPHAAAEAVERVATREHRRIDAEMAALVYLGWSLPTLGFIGTVLGLGTALLTAGDMVTPVSELQRDAIQTVSIYLGRAFDKTFIALLLSLVIMAFIYAVRHAQEAVLLTLHEQITRGVVRRLRGYMPRPTAA